MKISLKQILAVSALAVASTSAFADVSLPNNGNGELVLVVWDQTTNTSYVRGLQIDMNQIATTAQITADSGYVAGSTAFNIPATLNVGPDANMTAFLSSTAPTDTVTWSVMGGAVNGSGNVVGVKTYVSTTAMDVAHTVTASSNAKITSNFSNLNAWETQFSGAIENANGGNTTIGNGQSSANAGFTATMSTWSGAWTGANYNQVAVGSAANFYLLSSSNGSAATAAHVYSLAALTLSANGTLTSADVGGGTVTPIPAAIWLLGSGLAGLVGIGRRKNVAA